VLFRQVLVAGTHYEPDFAALEAASTRIVMAAGEESEGELASRAPFAVAGRGAPSPRVGGAAGEEPGGGLASRGAFAVAERLGTKPVLFPSGHGGFLGGEDGQTGGAGAFRAKPRRGPPRQ